MTRLALIAGSGDLPRAVLAAQQARGRETVVCALDGTSPSMPVDMSFRIEHFASFLKKLRAGNVDEICLAGSIKRPRIDPGAVNAETLPLLSALQSAVSLPDQSASHLVIALLEATGLRVVGAHDIAPDLLPQAGVLTRAAPRDQQRVEMRAGDRVLNNMALSGVGQACMLRGGAVLAREGPDGTDAMILGMAPRRERGLGVDNGIGAILFKGARPGQDRRVDLPVIGPRTVAAARVSGLSGIVIAAGDVMVLNLPEVVAACDEAGLFLWVRPTPSKPL